MFTTRPQTLRSPRATRRAFVGTALLFGLSLSVLGTGCDLLPEPPKVPGAARKVSVMSFNIRYDNPEDGKNRWELRRPACAKLLDDASPDFVGFQEVLHSQLNALAQDMPEYSWVGVGRDDGASAGEYAPVFYKKSLFEVLDSGTFWLSETPNEVSRGWDAAATRIVTWAKFRRVNEKSPLFVFNTHFDHKGTRARQESAKLLAKKVKEIAGEEPMVFLTGDFNARLSDPLFDPLRELFFDARNAPETDKTRTFNAWGSIIGWFVGRIDFVLYRNAQVQRFRTIEHGYGVRFVSDHYPVMGWFVY